MFQEEPPPRSCCCLGATGETGHGLRTGNPFPHPNRSPLPLTLPAPSPDPGDYSGEGQATWAPRLYPHTSVLWVQAMSSAPWGDRRPFVPSPQSHLPGFSWDLWFFLGPEHPFCPFPQIFRTSRVMVVVAVAGSQVEWKGWRRDSRSSDGNFSSWGRGAVG